MENKKIKLHVCSECLDELLSKELYVAFVPNREYYTIYCLKCLKELNIKTFRKYTSDTFKGKVLTFDDIEVENTNKKQTKKASVKKVTAEKVSIKKKSTTKK